MKKSRSYFAIIILMMINCTKTETIPSSSPTTPGTIYLNEVLNIMTLNSINRKKIDWADFKATVLKKAEGAQTIADAYPAIEMALGLLNDHHSFYITSKGSYILNNYPNCDQAVPGIVPPSKIGYVRVPGFSGSTEEATTFATNLQANIHQQDAVDLKGWIVDLRENIGGNMWPMIAGIGPILGEGIVGNFIDIDDQPIQWLYKDGASFIGSSKITSVANPYQLLVKNPKVAVLIGLRTSSSGEATAISFIGRPNTKLFGLSSTCGLSTANAAFTLSDNAQLFLTVSFMADRNLKKYGVPVPPDSLVNGTTNDLTSSAINWILK
ncbi:MAG: S41 family peptidase [Cyclobacteriaceae bacterium]